MFLTNKVKFVLLLIAVLLVLLYLNRGTQETTQTVEHTPSTASSTKEPHTTIQAKSIKKELKKANKPQNKIVTSQSSGSVLEEDIPDDELVDIDTEYIPSQSTNEPISEEEMAENEADILKALEENKNQGGESYEEEETQEIKIKKETKEEVYERLSSPLTEEALGKIEKEAGLLDVSHNVNSVLDQGFDPDKQEVINPSNTKDKK